MKSTAALAAALSLSLAGITAHAQGVGDTVRIETAKGTIEGTLVDRLPAGYLVNKGKTSVVVPYLSVTNITKLAPAPLAPMTLPAGAPAKKAPKGAAAAPAADTFQGFAVDPAPVAPAPAGIEPPPPPPVPMPAPAPMPVPVPALSPVMVPLPALPAVPRPAAPPVQYERRSKLVMGTGIVFVGLGVAAFITGLGLVIDGQSKPEQLCEYYASGQRCFNNPYRSRNTDAGRITMLAGTAVGVLGIPIWSIGAKRVPVKGPATSAELSAGLGRAALTLRF